MITALMGQRITIQHRANSAKDSLGHSTIQTVSTETNRPARLEQKKTVEGSGFFVDEFMAYVAPGASISPLDRIIEGSRTFEVVGSPSVQVIPGFPSASHIEVNLKLVKGK
jgi:hypothetical protein